jgi:indolepyruvate ferredoxin oxidoreductase beta subunit
METKSIVIAGVGGQGVLLASDILCHALFQSGYDVKKNEIHGMSQREGAVVSFIRYGQKVHSPVISEDGADFLVSFERLEAMRNLPLLRRGGTAVVNDFRILPTPVLMGKAEYPEDIEPRFAAKGIDLHLLDAEKIAREVKNPKAVNIVLLGSLSGYFGDVKKEMWGQAIRAFSKAQFLESNLKAFELGMSARSKDPAGV